MIEKKLVSLFRHYISAFKRYDIAAVQQCYYLPCTLHTPDKIAYLANKNDFEREFIDIFTVLQHANTKDILITKAGFGLTASGDINLCIDWAFTDDKDEVFADFCAFYHVIEVECEYKIVSVVSHSLSNSVDLPCELTITN